MIFCISTLIEKNFSRIFQKCINLINLNNFQGKKKLTIASAAGALSNKSPFDIYEWYDHNIITSSTLKYMFCTWIKKWSLYYDRLVDKLSVTCVIYIYVCCHISFNSLTWTFLCDSGNLDFQAWNIPCDISLSLYTTASSNSSRSDSSSSDSIISGARAPVRERLCPILSTQTQVVLPKLRLHLGQCPMNKIRVRTETIRIKCMLNRYF